MSSLSRWTTLVTALALALTAVPAGLAQGETVPRFEEADCPFGGSDLPVACGYLVVPEDRADPNAGTIRLAVAVIEQTGGSPGGAPVVYLTGGPGGSAFGGIFRWLDSPILDQRPFILLEQRGTKYSEPALLCPEMDLMDVEGFTYVLPDEDELAAAMLAVAECRDRLTGEGVNLAAYHSAASAADLNDLRALLGYDEWTLYGISYGTRLALTVMRDYPEGLRSVVLDSTLPVDADLFVEVGPNTMNVLATLFDGCAADPDCSAAFPDLEADFYTVVDAANANPISLTVQHPDARFGQVEVLLDGADFLEQVFYALYNAWYVPILPIAISEAAQGDYTLLQYLTESNLASFYGLGWGMYLSVNCQEELPFNTPGAAAAAIADAPASLKLDKDMAFMVAACEIWGVGKSPPVEDAPVYSDVPTLILAGEYDPITPPAWGRQVADTLSSAVFLEFPGLAHGVTLSHHCPFGILLDFLEDPAAKLDASCIDAMGPPEFITDY